MKILSHRGSRSPLSTARAPRARRITTEHAIVGFGLISVGLAGLAVGLVSDTDPLIVLAFFGLAAVLSFLRRHYTGIHAEEVSRARELPKRVEIDSSPRIGLRVSPVLAIAGLLVLIGWLVGLGLAAAVGGLAVGQGLAELQPAYWFRRWERANGVQVFAAAPRAFYYPKNSVPEMYVRSLGEIHRDAVTSSTRKRERAS
jgi:hypothetical protein